MKLNITSVFEVARLAATKSGQELRELLEHVSNLTKQVVPALSNKLTFTDNFQATLKSVELTSETAQVIGTGGKTPTDVLLTRVVSTTAKLDTFGWYLNAQSELVVTAKLVPDPGEAVECRLLILHEPKT